MKRGDVVGENGYFGQRRSASVDTLTETRLLRFDDEDQERLCVAYPAIASRVFLSLNRIQAKHQVERSLSKSSPGGDKRAEGNAADGDSSSFDSSLN